MRWFVFLSTVLFFCSGVTIAAPEKKLMPYWQGYEASSTETISHQPWQAILDQYLVVDDPSGVHLFDYQRALDAGANKTLKEYLAYLQSIPITQYNRSEQMAYWINLYNSLTVDVVMDHYPISSILKIRFGLFSFTFGPWDQKLVTVENKKLSLNDIEHHILRPIWNDPRIHYAVNCASMGCPNLSARAYSAAELDKQLDDAARQYINDQRGLHFNDDNKALVLSKIYHWYAEDFGDSQQTLFKHLSHYLDDGAKRQHLASFDGEVNYEYDWALNDRAH